MDQLGPSRHAHHSPRILARHRSRPPPIVLPRRVKHAFHVTIQRPHHSDPRKHRRPVMLCDQKQRFHRGLPFRRIMFCLRQLGDVERGVAEGGQLAPVGKLDWFVELRCPSYGQILTTQQNRDLSVKPGNRFSSSRRVVTGLRFYDAQH